MVFAVRDWGGVLRLLGLWLLVGASSALALQPSHGSTLTLTPSTGEVSMSTVAEVMCDSMGDISLEAAQV